MLWGRAMVALHELFLRGRHFRTFVTHPGIVCEDEMTDPMVYMSLSRKTKLDLMYINHPVAYLSFEITVSRQWIFAMARSLLQPNTYLSVEVLRVLKHTCVCHCRMYVNVCPSQRTPSKGTSPCLSVTDVRVSCHDDSSPLTLWAPWTRTSLGVGSTTNSIWPQ